MSRTPGIDTHVLGCKVNFADVAAVAGRLPDLGDEPVALVGTCCVTAEGEKQSRQAVRRAARKVGAGGTVFVTGCAARRDPEVFAGLAQNVVLLDDDAEESARMISGLMGKAKAELPVAAVGRTRFFLKVQDGCASGCSYCVIPQVRGHPRSVPLARLKAEAQAAVAAGYPELVVTGINVGKWRDGELRLPELLDEMAGTEGLKRLRLSSVEIGHLTGDLVEVMRRHQLIGRHLHLPLQSGDDAVLRAMGRRYTADEYARRVSAAREVLPDINITTDAIVGFPTENDIAFNKTMWLIENVGFSKVHVFSYSPRPGTAAAALADSVPATVKKRRSRFLRFLSDRLQKAHRQRKLGGVSEVLLESAPDSRISSGYSSDYTRFIVEGGSPGQLVSVVAKAVTDEGVTGKVVDYG